MAILAFDTSGECCSVALQTPHGCFEKNHYEPRKQAEWLLPIIDELLNEASLKRHDLTGIALTHGPGAFTGVRIAVAAAQGLAYALDLPVVTVSTLQTLAQSAYRKLGWERVVSAVDARMNEVYWGCYQLNENHLMQAHIEDKISQPQEVKLPKEPRTGWYGAGSGWVIYQDQLPRVNEVHNLTLEAVDILQLALPLFKKNQTIMADKISPLYLRNAL